MAYLGNQPVVGDSANTFKLLDDISTFTLTFDGSSASVVSVANNTLTFANHRFVTGQRVTYGKGGGTVITGLTDATAYFIIKVDQSTIKLATNASNAASSTAIDLTGLGAGTSHTLNVAFDGVNTKFKATHTNGTKANVSRAAQLSLSINGVIQQPTETKPPTVGYGIEADSTIVFSTAPVSTDKAFGSFIGEVAPSFDLTDNTVDNFTGDGSTTSFTLSKEIASSQDVLVTLDGVTQYPSDTSTTRAYSVIGQTLTFVSAPADGVAIQARHIGFAGATSSEVTGFYGRTGNVALKSTDDITFQNASAGIITATTFGGNPSFTGSVSIGGTITYEDVTNIDSVGLITAREGIFVSAGSSIGIGTAAPADILHLRSTDPILKVDATNNASGLRIDVLGQTGGSNNQLFRVQRDATTKFQINDDGDVVITGDDDSELKLKAGTSSGVDKVSFLNSDGDTKGNIFYDTDDNFLAIKTNGVNATDERLRIDSNGNVNIGSNTTANPFTYLRFGASQYGAADIRPTNEASHKVGLSFYVDGTQDTTINPTEALRITSAGLVGIGTSIPNSYDQGGRTLVLDQGGTFAGITIRSSQQGSIYFADGLSGNEAYRGRIEYKHDTDSLDFGTAGTATRLRITSAGIIQCGTSGTLKAEINNAVSGHQFISQCSDNNNGFEVYQQHGSTSSRNTFATYDNRGNSGAKQMSFAVIGDGNVKIVDGDLIFGTNGNALDFQNQTIESTSNYNRTVTAEKIDYYEEGYLDPTAISAGLTWETSNNRQLRYVRIGNWVSVSGLLTVSSRTSNSNTIKVAMPFTSASQVSEGYYTRGVGAVMYQYVTLSANMDDIVAYVGGDENYMRFFQTRKDGGGWTELVNSNLGGNNSCQIYFSVNYMVA